MTTLEMRYRRLLRVYPAGHRAAYEEEMIGVLMSGADPGRRHPSPAEAIDLLRAGLTARLGRAVHTQRGTGWRDAAAVTALFGALLLAGGAVSRLVTGLALWGQGDPLRARGADGLMLLDPAARSAIWLVVVAAAVLGLRRATFALATVGVLVQAGTVWFWSVPGWGLMLLGGLAAAIAVAGLFAVAVPGRRARAVLGIRGLLAAAAGAVLAAATRLPVLRDVWSDPMVDGQAVLQFGLPGLLLAVAAWHTGRWVRGRVAVLAAVLLAITHVVNNVEHANSGGETAVSVLLPVAVLAGGVTLVRVRERLAGRGHGHVLEHE